MLFLELIHLADAYNPKKRSSQKVKRLMRAPVTGSGSAKISRLHLPPAMLNKAVGRLCWISLFVAVMTVALFVFQLFLQPEVGDIFRQPFPLAVFTGMVAVNILFMAAHRKGYFSPQTVLHFGLAYEVLMALGIALLETSLPYPARMPVRGVSAVAVWITLCGLLVPNTPFLTLAGALASAAMWPLAYFFNLQFWDHTPMPLNRFLMWNIPTFALAFWTYILNSRIYKIEMEAERARELGSYELQELIGKGGMGEVWRAHHRLLARDAAIKLIRTDILAAQTGRNASLVRRRFETEAKATAALRSPHTVSLYDYGPADDGTFYYAMELLDGIDLESLVKEYGPLPPARVVHILLEACDSLEEAHRAGLIHRDVKPTNLFVCRVGMRYDFVKVLDFGLVKAELADGESRMTKDGMTTGTPAYMAPEIALGKDNVDGRADVYGLGCLAYYLLTGRLVFEESTATAQALAHVSKEPIPPSERTELPVPESFEKLILRCLAKDPAARPRSAQALADALERLPGVPRWTREDAVSWWQLHQPSTSRALPDMEALESHPSLSEVHPV
jgi:eukaryotic-like serine/threonine-protein kinase